MNEPAMRLRRVLADAILLGTRLAEHGYSSPILSKDAASVLQGIEQLRASTKSFLDSAELRSVSDQDVFPLLEEIAKNQTRRSERAHEG